MFQFRKWLLLTLIVTLLAVSCSQPAEPEEELSSANDFQIVAVSPCEIESGAALPFSVDSKAGQPLPAGATIRWSASSGTFSPSEGTITNYSADAVTSDTPVIIQVALATDAGEIPLSVQCMVLAAEATVVPSPTDEPTSEPTEVTTVTTEEETADDEVETEPTPIPEVVTIDQLLNDGKIIIAVHEDFEPFSYVNEDGERVGFELDIANEFVRRWFGDTSVVEFKFVGGDEKFAILERGEAHLTIAAVTRTFERCERVSCTINYFEDGARIIVHPDSGITSICDLDGQNVSGQASTTAIPNIEEEMPRWCQYKVPPIAKVYETHQEGIDAVKTGIVEAYTSDGTAMLSFARDNPPLVVVGDPFTSEPYSALAAKQNTEIQTLMDATLQQMKIDGTYDMIYRKWFGCEEAPFAVIIDRSYPEKFVTLATATEFVSMETCSAEPMLTTYVIEGGDTLGGIARRLMGSFDFYGCIHDFNRDVIGDNASQIQAGVTIEIPDVAQCDA